ncbi:hypothetical protein SpCBS45565_g04429 [Spizellomyces sp. 'palustris']|nr:hypothetical protein SpCBS45565_g04429 [Spizellomyces sp. 'palustris']
MGQAHTQSKGYKPIAQPSSSAKRYFVLSITFIAGILLGSQALKLDKIQALFPSTAGTVEATVEAPVEAWKTRRFYPEDFETWFGLRHTHQLIIPDSLKPYLESHDLTTDEYYIGDKEVYDNYARVFGPILDTYITNDRRFYVQWTGEDKKFGVFTDAYIPPYAFITEYSGMLVNASRSTDYEWHYYSRIRDENGNTMSLGVDSQFIGNIARFVNHNDDPNCDVVYVPWNNVWRPIYVSIKPLYPGEELTVSYGQNYWASRKKAEGTGKAVNTVNTSTK